MAVWAGRVGSFCVGFTEMDPSKELGSFPIVFLSKHSSGCSSSFSMCFSVFPGFVWDNVSIPYGWLETQTTSQERVAPQCKRCFRVATFSCSECVGLQKTYLFHGLVGHVTAWKSPLWATAFLWVRSLHFLVYY